MSEAIHKSEEGSGARKLPRLLCVSHETTLSGAPVQLLHLVRWLQRSGWEVRVAAPEPGPISELLSTDGFEVILDEKLLTDLTFTRLRALCRGHDVVIANTIVSWPAVQAAHRENIPVIWYLHETLEAVRLLRLIPEIRPTLHLADVLVTPTQQTARVYEGLSLTPIEVIPYGIPRVSAGDVRKKSEHLHFVALGSFEPRKGQDVLVEAIGKLPSEVGSETFFTMAGRVLDVAFFEGITKAAAALPNVKLIEALDHDAATSLLNEADILLCPSRDETMPIAILEAMSLGKIVISTDVGGVTEWLRDGMNGLVIPRENPNALATAIARCVDEPALMKRLSAAAARTFDKHFTLDRFATRFAALLESTARREVKHKSSATRSYQEWIELYDSPSGSNRLALRRRLRGLQRQPVVSVILPVYNPDLNLLEAAIASVERQLYDRWELCMADDASTDSRVRIFLEEKSRRDARIKVIYRKTNGHISAASNSALDLATGEWCALLDQDDLLSANALAWVALEIDQFPDAGLIYSDEDKIDESEVRSNPFFKTDWNPELFFGQNYINHLGVYRSDLLRQIGGFREGFSGSQDYDLALRCIEHLRPEQVRHIPRILYHWRQVAGSLAAVPDAKPYAKDAARRAIADHLRRKGSAGRVERCPENIESHRVIHSLPAVPPLVSIIIPTRDNADLLEYCIVSIRERTDYTPIEIIIVDNGSVEAKSRELLSRFEQDEAAHVLHHRGAFNYSRLNNLGAAQARGEILLFLNDDTEVENRDWLTELVSQAARTEVGAVGARLWYRNDTLQHGGVVLGIGGLAGHEFPKVPRGHPGYFNRAFLQHNCSAVTGACLAMRKQVFQEIDGFDEENLAVNFSDIDLCLRLRAKGYEVVWTPYANLLHVESASRGSQRTDEEQTQFLNEANYMRAVWGAQLMNDPFYNPNLSLNVPGFEIAFSPRLPDFVNEEVAAICAR